jgi:ADP-ribose pyrophosphatase YjhB (NUDIX family)
VREVLEETNVVVSPMRLTGVYKNMNLGVVALVMRAEVVSGEARLPPTSSEVDWWSPARVRADMTEAFAIRILDAARRRPVPCGYSPTTDGIQLM